LSCLLGLAARAELTAGFLSLAYVGYKMALASNSSQLGVNQKSKKEMKPGTSTAGQLFSLQVHSENRM